MPLPIIIPAAEAAISAIPAITSGVAAISPILGALLSKNDSKNIAKDLMHYHAAQEPTRTVSSIPAQPIVIRPEYRDIETRRPIILPRLNNNSISSYESIIPGLDSYLNPTIRRRAIYPTNTRVITDNLVSLPGIEVLHNSVSTEDDQIVGEHIKAKHISGTDEGSKGNPQNQEKPDTNKWWRTPIKSSWKWLRTPSWSGGPTPLRTAGEWAMIGAPIGASIYSLWPDDEDEENTSAQVDESTQRYNENKDRWVTLIQP